MLNHGCLRCRKIKKPLPLKGRGFRGATLIDQTVRSTGAGCAFPGNGGMPARPNLVNPFQPAT